MLKRAAGILVPLFSLRTESDLGVGEIGDLAAMLEWATAMGHRMIQLLPLDETGPAESSPYSALSVTAIDPQYISIASLNGVPESDLRKAREELGDARIVPREKFRRLKFELLQRAFARFARSADSAERAEFDSFCAQNAAWLPDYALFRALKDRFMFSSWETWPDGLSRRRQPALATARRELADSITKYTYWQFLAHRQMLAARTAFARVGAMLGGDLAFSPGRDSAEVWAHQEHFDLDRFVGAPPDAFNPRGQRWGLPMPRWELARAQGWPLLRMRMRRARELYDLIRVDHVVGLFRTFNFGSNPDERGHFTPASETEQREQGEAIMRAIIEEAAPSAVIAEDLGSVPPWVRASLRDLGVPGYKILRWEKEGQGGAEERFVSPARYPELSVAASGTHDTETMVVWWRESPPDERRRLIESLGLGGRADPERARLDQAALDAILEAIYAAPSRLTISPVQDLFGWRARINLPGTVRGGNWSWRLPATIEHLMTSRAMVGRAGKLRAIAMRTGRFQPGPTAERLA